MALDLSSGTTALDTDATLPADVLAHLGHHLTLAYELPDSVPWPESLGVPLARLERALASTVRPSAAETLRGALLTAMPALRGFAYSLTQHPERADDLVQDTLVRAWAKADSFTPGTNLTAWLFTILRNLFYSEQRKRKREVEDADGAFAARLATLPDQNAQLDLRDFHSALVRLPAAQQEALILIGAHGLSYDEAAEVCGVAVGTVKSRVNRARTRLVEVLKMDGAGDIGADSVTRAAGMGFAA